MSARCWVVVAAALCGVVVEGGGGEEEEEEEEELTVSQWINHGLVLKLRLRRWFSQWQMRWLVNVHGRMGEADERANWEAIGEYDPATG